MTENPSEIAQGELEQWLDRLSKALAVIKALKAECDLNMDGRPPYEEDDNDPFSDLIIDIKTTSGEQIKVRVPINEDPIFEIIPDTVSFSRELYREKLADLLTKS